MRVTVCFKDDGSGYNGVTVDEAYIDTFLADLNGKMSTEDNTYNFFRCGPLNDIHVDELYEGSQGVHAYSYVPYYINLYLFNASGNPVTNPPWVLGEASSTIFLPSGPANITSSSGHHEFGHVVGLFHTFHVNDDYIVPLTPAQVDYPYDLDGSSSIGRRELMLEDEDQSKDHPLRNKDQAGDGVYDTPPGCDEDETFPSSVSIPGCWDTDTNTPCVNNCNDTDPITPCLAGCVWDYMHLQW